MKEYIYYFKTKIGPWKVMGRGDGEALHTLYIEGQGGYMPEGCTKECQTQDYLSHRCFQETEKWLAEYAKGKNPDFVPKLKLVGTPFRKLIWQELLKIPYGETITYGQLSEKAAEAMGIKQMSPQAVGGAVGNNPVSLIVPCHRVIGKDGKLTGYQGGIDKKEYLLLLEGNRDFAAENSNNANNIGGE